MANEKLPLAARLPSRGIFEDDWRARPSPAHPYPVILIHGTGVTKGDWMELGAELRAAGYAVFAPDFGDRSTAPVAESATQIAAYIEAVCLVTQADKLIVVGHSQGGILARYWMHFLGGAARTRHLVSLSVPHHGTTSGGIMNPVTKVPRGEQLMGNFIENFFGPCGNEMLDTSSLIAELNADGDTLPGIYYSNIITRNDAIIRPAESGFLQGELSQNLYARSPDAKGLLFHEDMPHNKEVRDLVMSEIARVEAL